MTSYTDIFDKNKRAEDMELYAGDGDVNNMPCRTAYCRILQGIYYTIILEFAS